MIWMFILFCIVAFAIGAIALAAQYWPLLLLIAIIVVAIVVGLKMKKREANRV
jgi:hypothetical protein